MKKYFRAALSLVCGIAVVMSAIFGFACSGIAYADAEDYVLLEEASSMGDGEIQPRASYNITIELSQTSSTVTARATNTYEFFVIKIEVYVQLFCSDTYHSDYLDMSVVAQNHTNDLNVGQSISASAAKGDTQKYWLARAYFKVDNRNWEDVITNVYYL